MARPDRHARQARRRARDGSAAVEFGMIALPFFLMLFAIIELAVVFTLDSVLENATIATGRLVRTGQAESQGFDETRFKQELCSRMSVFSVDCESRATVDVRVVDRFDAPPPPSDPDSPPDFYDGGQPGDLMLVTVRYSQTVLTPFLDQAVSQSGYKAVLTATTAFRNEPWGGTPTPIGG